MNGSQMVAGAALVAVGALVGLLVGAWRWRRPGPAAASGAELAWLLAPAASALDRVERHLQEVERSRIGAYAGLTEQVGALHRTSAELGAQTRALSDALRSPGVRGRWGEMQLQRIVELAGMVEHCDFQTQVSAPGDADGPGVRPDLLIRLAGGRTIPVDAKVPMEAWLAAQQYEAGPAGGLSRPGPTDDAAVHRRLVAHARAMRAHVDALAAKAYWDAFRPSPEFVVMFVPGEPLLDAAMRVDPGLADHAFARKVVIATPTTLIALLRTVAFTWRQERLAESAEQILDLGRDLHRRLSTVGGHLSAVGRSLDRAVQSYNSAVGSMESRVLVTARRFVDLGVGEPPLEALAPIDRLPRHPQAPEWAGEPAPNALGENGPVEFIGGVAHAQQSVRAAPAVEAIDAAQEWDERYGRSATGGWTEQPAINDSGALPTAAGMAG